MKFPKSKLIIILLIAILLLSGAYFTLGGFGVSGPSSAPNLSEHGLVGYWNMEEGTGQTVYDRSGNGNNGTLGANSSVGKDDPVFTSGYSSSGPGGTALQFDGVDDYVAPSSLPLSNTGTTYTIEAWIKNTAVATNAVIYSQSSSSESGILGRLYRSSNKIAFTTRNDSGGNFAWALGTTSLTSNNWYHVVGVRDGSNVYVYLNGIQDGTDNDAGGTITSNSVAIGRWISFGTPGGYFNGSIDEVRIYNRALSADEIRQLYNQKKPVLEWKFDEGSGTTIKDETFNNNDGTLHE